MKKFMNQPGDFVKDSLEGVLCAYPRFLRAHEDDIMAIVRTEFTDPGKISLVTGGGFGHIPLFLGYVGEGLCDGVAVGNVFSTPSANTIKRVTEMVPTVGGVVYIMGNFVGDRINFEMAAQAAWRKGIRAACVVVQDDVMSAPKREKERRRCIGGIVFMYKVLGAAARRGYALEDIMRLSKDVNDNMGSYGVAMTPCQIPSTNNAIFEIGEKEMEHGTGIHGERGMERTSIMDSKDIAAKMVCVIVDDLPLKSGDEVALMVNVMGATPKDEGFILYRDVYRELEKLGITVALSFVDNYVSSLEMSGASVTLMRMNEERKALMGELAYSPFMHFADIAAEKSQTECGIDGI